ncbi:hypothetical protein GIB67_009686 [Kingdonia uniflora]|uniref:Uncharacterized protein n=1 Tax=Kingdonia uniflora TaxID=39325 RepID=A0A7J7LBB4_9MAGN|nr:hypothetical protein GIB67_009686 [Kingdonia uniflora]
MPVSSLSSLIQSIKFSKLVDSIADEWYRFDPENQVITVDLKSTIKCCLILRHYRGDFKKDIRLNTTVYSSKLFKRENGRDGEEAFGVSKAYCSE